MSQRCTDKSWKGEKREEVVWSWDRLAMTDHLWTSDEAVPNITARELDDIRSCTDHVADHALIMKLIIH